MAFDFKFAFSLFYVSPDAIFYFSIHVISEAEKQELINEAEGQAEAVIAAGRARAQSIELVSKALGEENGQNAAALAVAEKYVTAFGELARTNNTLILPANTGDVSNMVAQVGRHVPYYTIDPYMYRNKINF